ncbi:MAG TPA: FAD binding domain-containing protein [Anaerolineales bacterium]|nr:FAD binding domain-containing protein [Anaerolineales bacterium]
MTESYFRPDNLQTAARLIKEHDGKPIYSYYVEKDPLQDKVFIDLQNCGLNFIEASDGFLTIGSGTSLQTILEDPNCPPALQKAIKLEEQLNRRNMLSLADCIFTGDGTSPVLTVLLAMDAKIRAVSEDGFMNLGDFLAMKDDRLLKSIQIPTNLVTVYETVSTTSADRPLIGAALSLWESDRVRLALGGTGKAPTLVVDGKGSAGIEKAAASAYLDAGDFKASKEYRSSMAQLLTLRCIGKIK